MSTGTRRSATQRTNPTSYKKIYKQTKDHFITNRSSVSENEKEMFQYLEPQDSSEDDLALKKFLSHVLLYLYNATENEIYDNEEVNKQLRVIKKVILQMLQEEE